MKRLLVICGPTATGKTSLAINLAKKYRGELVSADSRQVYRGLNIGTGKDIPKGSKWHPEGFWETRGGIKIWGLDLVSPKQKFSVAQYQDRVEKIIANIHKRKNLPILVGGTGLYIKAVVDGIKTANIPPNYPLRNKLKKKSTEKLFEILFELSPSKAVSLNTSDKKNPRRLIRAIEISKSSKSSLSHQIFTNKNTPTLFIGLIAPKEILFKNIEKRVQKRLKKGILQEINLLLKKGVSWEDQSMQALGYRQFRKYFEGKVGLTEAIENWIKEEKNYAKRQITWFKRDPRIKWFNVSDPNFTRKVEEEVSSWHNKS